ADAFFEFTLAAAISACTCVGFFVLLLFTDAFFTSVSAFRPAAVVIIAVCCVEGFELIVLPELFFAAASFFEFNSAVAIPVCDWLVSFVLALSLIVFASTITALLTVSFSVACVKLFFLVAGWTWLDGSVVFSRLATDVLVFC